MRVAIIGRTEILYDTALRLRNEGHEIAFVLTAREAPEYKRTAEDFQALAKSWGVPFLQTPHAETAINTIRSLPTIDVGVSMNYSGIVPASVIDLFALGILNAHGGDLPRYRGNACQAWAILNGEERAGLCIHRMIGGELDSGDILAREFHPIDIRTKVTELYDWMSQRVPFLFSESLMRLESNPSYVLEVQSKDPRNALRCYPRRPDDGRIVWGASALSVVRLVNACNKPYEGAFFFISGRKVVVWDALPVEDDERFCAVPGQVTRIDPPALEVACGSGKVRLAFLESEGKPICSSELIRSLRARLE